MLELLIHGSESVTRCSQGEWGGHCNGNRVSVRAKSWGRRRILLVVPADSTLGMGRSQNQPPCSGGLKLAVFMFVCFYSKHLERLDSKQKLQRVLSEFFLKVVEMIRLVHVVGSCGGERSLPVKHIAHWKGGSEWPQKTQDVIERGPAWQVSDLVLAGWCQLVIPLIFIPQDALSSFWLQFLCLYLTRKDASLIIWSGSRHFSKMPMRLGCWGGWCLLPGALVGRTGGCSGFYWTVLYLMKNLDMGKHRQGAEEEGEEDMQCCECKMG